MKSQSRGWLKSPGFVLIYLVEELLQGLPLDCTWVPAVPLDSPPDFFTADLPGAPKACAGRELDLLIEGKKTKEKGLYVADIFSATL